jgi:hypothetical protein
VVEFLKKTMKLGLYFNQYLKYRKSSMNLILEKQTKVSPKKKVSKNYFTQETEDAIVLYNNTPDSVIRSEIYESKIHYAFFKLTQNIIHTLNFTILR